MPEPEWRFKVEAQLPDDAGAEWPWRDVGDFVREDGPAVHVRQGTFNPTGGPYYPPPPRRWRVWVIQPDGTRRQVTGQPRRRWWMFWRRRG